MTVMAAGLQRRLVIEGYASLFGVENLAGGRRGGGDGARGRARARRRLPETCTQHNARELFP